MVPFIKDASWGERSVRDTSVRVSDGIADDILGDCPNTTARNCAQRLEGPNAA